jgi:hypothetical protein
LKKRIWGDLTALWVAPDVRDAIMDFIAHWSERTEIGALRLVGWIGLSRRKFYSGVIVTAKPMNTTLWCRAIIGGSRGKRRP